MEANSFVCKKLRATSRGQQNGNNPAVEEGELREQPRQQNGNDPAVGEVESREQPPQQNGNGPAVEVDEPSQSIDESNGANGAVEQGEESRNKRTRSITPEEEVKSREQLSQRNGNDPAVKQGKESTEKLVKRNRTVEEVESREQPPQPNGNGPAVEQVDEPSQRIDEPNGTNGAVEQVEESRNKRNRSITPEEQEDGSIRYYKDYVTSDQRNVIVDLDTLADRLWCVTCDLPISLMNVVGIQIDGLVRIYHVHCQICDKVWGVPTSAHGRDFTPRPSELVSNDLDSSAVPSTSQANGSSSPSDDSDSSPVPSTSQENGSSSPSDDSDSSPVPSTSQENGSNIVKKDMAVVILSETKLKIVSSPSKASTATTKAASTSAKTASTSAKTASTSAASTSAASTSAASTSAASTSAASTSTASTSATTASTSAAETSTEAPKVENKVEGVYKRVKGRFIINLEWLAKKLWCEKCRRPLSLRHVLKLRVDGLAAIFLVHCRKCQAQVVAETCSQDDRVNRYKVNEQALHGINALTKQVMDSVFAIMDLLPIPTELELFEPSPLVNPRPVEAGEENAENPRPEEARGENVVTLESNDESSELGETNKSKKDKKGRQ